MLVNLLAVATRAVRVAFTMPEKGRYDNPHHPASSLGIAWYQGKNAEDGEVNPYHLKSIEWQAWRKGNLAQQKSDLVIL